MRRFRVKLARLLLKGTGVITVHREEVERVHALCDELSEYSQHSGALNDPRRIKARRRIGHLTGALSTTHNRIEANA